MPDYIKSNGQTSSIPGLAEYAETVILNQPGPTPTFMVPMLIGDAPYGIPYNFDSLKKTGEAALGPFRMQRTDSLVHDTWGLGSDIAVAFRNAQRSGLPMAFITTPCALTRSQVVVTSTGPVSEFALYSRLFGAPGAHHKVKWASSIMTITPVARFALLSAAVTTSSTRIYVQGNDPDVSPIGWVTPGQTLYLGDADTPNFAVVVAESGAGRQLDSNGQWQYFFDITAVASAAVEISTKYGMVVLYGDDEVSPAFSAGQGQAVIDWINDNSKVLAAAAESGTFSGVLPIAVATSTPLKDLSTTWGTITVGVSPASSASDWATFLTNYKATYWDQFRTLWRAKPYLHLCLTTSATAHASLRSFAVDRRKNALFPVSILIGAGFTDTDLSASDSTNPIYRAMALNHQDIQLFAGRAGRLAPALTLGASAFGQYAANGSLHSITRKDIFETGLDVTKFWDEANSGQLTALIRAGVITYMLSPGQTPAWQFTSGVNTNQDRATTWSPNTNTGCMAAARNSVNEFWAGLYIVLDRFSGVVGVSDSTVGSAIYAYADRQLRTRKLIRSFGSPTLEESTAEAAWRITAMPIEPVAETLYLGVSLNILSR